jgi:hypothetical protein
MKSGELPCCSTCRHFDNAPHGIEAALPGLSSLSSAYAAVRGEDGICRIHDRYLAATSRCGHHAELMRPLLALGSHKTSDLYRGR